MALYEGGRAFRSTGGQDGASLGAILGDLGLQGVEPGKALLGTQPLDQRDAQMAAIEIAVEIEEMGLQAEIRAAHRRPKPKIGGSGEPPRRATLFDPGAHGIDPGGGPQIIGEREISR